MSRHRRPRRRWSRRTSRRRRRKRKRRRKRRAGAEAEPGMEEGRRRRTRRRGARKLATMTSCPSASSSGGPAHRPRPGPRICRRHRRAVAVLAGAVARARARRAQARARDEGHLRICTSDEDEDEDDVVMVPVKEEAEADQARECRLQRVEWTTDPAWWPAAAFAFDYPTTQASRSTPRSSMARVEEYEIEPDSVVAVGRRSAAGQGARSSQVGSATPRPWYSTSARLPQAKWRKVVQRGVSGAPRRQRLTAAAAARVKLRGRARMTDGVCRAAASAPAGVHVARRRYRLRHGRRRAARGATAKRPNGRTLSARRSHRARDGRRAENAAEKEDYVLGVGPTPTATRRRRAAEHVAEASDRASAASAEPRRFSGSGKFEDLRADEREEVQGEGGRAEGGRVTREAGARGRRAQESKTLEEVAYELVAYAAAAAGVAAAAGRAPTMRAAVMRSNAHRGTRATVSRDSVLGCDCSSDPIERLCSTPHNALSGLASWYLVAPSSSSARARRCC